MILFIHGVSRHYHRELAIVSRLSFSSLTEPLQHDSLISLIKESSNFSLKEALSLKLKAQNLCLLVPYWYRELYNVKILESSVKPHFNDEMSEVQ